MAKESQILGNQKGKLESLCRALQKRLIALQASHTSYIEKEFSRREDLSQRFEETIWGIKKEMKRDAEERKKWGGENEVLRECCWGLWESQSFREKEWSVEREEWEIRWEARESRMRTVVRDFDGKVR